MNEPGMVGVEMGNGVRGASRQSRQVGVVLNVAGCNQTAGVKGPSGCQQTNNRNQEGEGGAAPNARP